MATVVTGATAATTLGDEDVSSSLQKHRQPQQSLQNKQQHSVSPSRCSTGKEQAHSISKKEGSTDKCKCSLCAKLPLRTPNYIYSMWDNAFLYENQYELGGMFDFFPPTEPLGDGGRYHHQQATTLGDAGRPYRLREERVSFRTACRAAEKAQKHLKHLQKDLAKMGLIESTEQNFSGDHQNARMIAPFDRCEIGFGCRLGSGGFSTVSEVASIRLLDTSSKLPESERDSRRQRRRSRKYSQLSADSRKEDDTVVASLSDPSSCSSSSNFTTFAVTSPEGVARKFLADHVKRPPHQPTKTKSGWFGKKRDKNTPPGSTVPTPSPYTTYLRTTARYAVKHLKRSLVENPEKFEKAAVDLALEAQLLLSVDHPNIISLRGWSRHGTDAFRGGCPLDYFLIMDCLPETLDDRIFSWRQAFRKYKSRATLPWNRKKFETKRRNLLIERLRVAHGIASAIEYLHDRRIINRDIKTANVGFDYEGTVQIFDLGLARLLPPESECIQDGYIMSRVGTKSTMAPEVQRKDPYNLSADVYSFGVVLWEILSLSTSSEYFRRQKRRQERAKRAEKEGTITEQRVKGDNAGVFSDDKKSQGSSIHRNNRSGLSASCPPSDDPGCPLPVCECWSQTAKDLVRKCLAPEAAARPTIAEIRSSLGRQIEELGVPFREFPLERRATFRLDLSDQVDTSHSTKSVITKVSNASTAVDIVSLSGQSD